MRPALAALLLLAALPDRGRAQAPPAPSGLPAGAGQLPSSHPPVPGAPSSQELLAQVEAMKAELRRRPRTVEIELALGNLYLANGRVLDAIDWYRTALETSAAWRERWLRIPAPARGARPSEAARRACVRRPDAGSRELAELGAARLAEGDGPGGAFCLREALGPSLEALSRRGNAWFLAGNPDQGVADHEEVLRLDPSRTDSLYFVGAILHDSAGDDLGRLRRAREAWLELRRRDPRSPRLAAVAEALPALEARIAGGGRPVPPSGAGRASPAAAPPATAGAARPSPPPPVRDAAPPPAGPPAPAPVPSRPAAGAPVRAPAGAAASPRELAARGEAAFRAGDYAAAVAAWKEAVSADPWLAGELGLRERIAEAESRLPSGRR